MTMYGRTLHDDRSDHFGVVTVQYALEHSSDVGAAKMALKLGPNKFYGYMRGFGFGDRSGIELPSETRGLLRSPKKWGSTSILSMAIGQEVGVTPVQLVTMVSALANGGVYMPPHVLLESTDEMKGDSRLVAAAFRPANQLPATLPDGAHRVISEITSAKMRMMMQGIVTEGTGKLAALNGYSSAGKTGTAQKIDVATHTYSHTKLVASFAGFAPVSNPAISIAVVIDTPTAGGEAAHYGGAASAPVFADVAQQVLEYLGVPHDQPLKTKKEMMVAQNQVLDDGPSESTTDLTAMFDDVNSLPADDPLRKPANVATVGGGDQIPVGAVAEKTPVAANLLPAKAVAAFKTGSSLTGEDNGDAAARSPMEKAVPAIRGKGAVVVDAGLQVPVPSFEGAGLRSVVEKADAVGLRVQAVGSGLAREQVPTAGTMVPGGTEVVVRLSAVVLRLKLMEWNMTRGVWDAEMCSSRCGVRRRMGTVL
jgi:cell division protein FtsI (penicillin-binding protein 3)